MEGGGIGRDGIGTGRYWKGRYWEGRYWEGRHWEGRYWEGRYWEGRYWDGQYDDCNLLIYLNIQVSLYSKEHHCELISIQNQTCNVYTESSSINYIGDRLTMTNKAAVIVSRHIFPEKFYVSVTTAMDDSACGPTVKHYVGDHKTVDFNVHLHHQSNGFLFLPTLLVPICSFLIMFGTLYLKYDSKPKPLPAIELNGHDNIDIDNDPAEMEIEDTNSTRSRTLSYIADDAFMIPDMFRTQVTQFTRHSLIPIIISIAIIPIFSELIGQHITRYAICIIFSSFKHDF